ncbi:hypothetical protein, partial [Halobacillus sp. BAB-2008]|uniref:hypothetical protein n=1 Tax=Halobacillus sp. BAB-2008 TaxID=1246484 RepID=UPI0019D39407
MAAAYPLIRLLFVIFLFYCMTTISVMSTWKYMVYSAVFIVVFQILLGLYQIINGKALGLTFLGESSEPFRATSLISITERGMSGTLGHPGVLGIFMVMISTFLLISYINNVNLIN